MNIIRKRTTGGGGGGGSVLNSTLAPEDYVKAVITTVNGELWWFGNDNNRYKVDGTNVPVPGGPSNGFKTEDGEFLVTEANEFLVQET